MAVELLVASLALDLDAVEREPADDEGHHARSVRQDGDLVVEPHASGLRVGEIERTPRRDERAVDRRAQTQPGRIGAGLGQQALVLAVTQHDAAAVGLEQHVHLVRRDVDDDVGARIHLGRHGRRNGRRGRRGLPVARDGEGTGQEQHEAGQQGAEPGNGMHHAAPPSGAGVARLAAPLAVGHDRRRILSGQGPLAPRVGEEREQPDQAGHHDAVQHGVQHLGRARAGAHEQHEQDQDQRGEELALAEVRRPGDACEHERGRQDEREEEELPEREERGIHARDLDAAGADPVREQEVLSDVLGGERTLEPTRSRGRQSTVRPCAFRPRVCERSSTSEANQER